MLTGCSSGCGCDNLGVVVKGKWMSTRASGCQHLWRRMRDRRTPCTSRRKVHHAYLVLCLSLESCKSKARCHALCYTTQRVTQPSTVPAGLIILPHVHVHALP